MLRKIILLLSGNVASAALTLARNLLVARLISVEDYGIAATFAVVISLIEMMSSFGMQQLIVQSKSDDPKWQAALQGFQVLRAAISAVVLFFLAGPIAAFLGVPEVAWAYQVLALVPLLLGCVHLDIHRMNRQMIYLPMMLTHTVPAFISLLMIWPLWLLFGDWRIMLIATVAQAGLGMVISLIMAERRWILRLDRAAIAGVIQFGWPLLINNMLLFAVLNGEKLIIGREIGMAGLAIFAMGFTLTLTPTLVMARSIQSFFLPQLSAVQDKDASFQKLARATIEANFFNGITLVMAVVLLGEPVVQLLLGDKYAALLPLMTWLAILQALRVFKAGGAVVGLARAKTSNAMVANMFRVISLPLSWWVAVQTGDLLLVIWIASLGELMGVIASLFLTRTQAKVLLRPLIPTFLAVVLFLATAVLYAAHPLWAPLAAQPRWLLMALCVVLFLICLWTMKSAQAYIKARQLELRDA